MLIRKTIAGGIVVYQSPCLLERRVRHAFSTRIGGVSSRPFASLNLGNPADTACRDDPANIRENYHRLLAALDLAAARQVSVRQVHGCGVAVVPAGGKENQSAGVATLAWTDFDGTVEADAIISTRPDTVLTIRTADCVPVLLAADDARTVAAVHAGWRGIVAGVIGRSVAGLAARGVKPARLTAAIGPAIGAEFFTVGPDVAAEFLRVGLQAAVVTAADRPARVDLQLAVRLQLQHMGIINIDCGDHCTFRDDGEFFSHRRDHGRTGRMAALIAATG